MEANWVRKADFWEPFLQNPIESFVSSVSEIHDWEC